MPNIQLPTKFRYFYLLQEHLTASVASTTVTTLAGDS